MMADELQATASYVRNILVVLQDLSLVETPARGPYEITPLGRDVLENVVQEKAGQS